VSVHIETIGAAEAMVEVGAAGATIGDDVYDQPTLSIGDGDTALVVTGSRQDLIDLLTRGLSAATELPEEG
jgi:hypothetical protein